MLRRLPLIALAAFVVCLQIFPVYANDLWMHLLLGRDTLATGVPHAEAYSYTAAGRPFVYHEWLSGVLLYGVHETAGISGLVLLQPLAALAIAALLLAMARTRHADLDLSALLAGAAIYVSSFRLFVRPHLLALPLLAATWALLLRLRRRGGVAPVLALVALQVLWTNVHGSFPEGPALAALFVAGEWIGRRFAGRAGRSPVPLGRLALLPPLLLAVSLLNPYGWELLRLAFLHPADPMFREGIFEYLPSFGARFRSTALFWPFVAWLALVAAAIGARRRRTDPALLLPAAAFGALAIWMNRAIADFAVVSFPLVAAGLSRPLRGIGERAGRWKPAAAAAALLAAAAGTLWLGYRFDDGSVRRFGFGVDPFTPVAATRLLEEASFHGNVFCSFPYGSYVAWRLAPAARVAFDSRTIPYGADLYREFREARRGLAAFREHLARYPVDAVLLAHRVDSSPEIHDYLLSSGEWEPVWFDPHAVLYVRPGGGAPPPLPAGRRAELRRLLGLGPASG